ncbi:MAG: DUF2141 domain-containing protein [Pseudomonadota bacterium]
MLKPVLALTAAAVMTACATAGESTTDTLENGRTDGLADLTIEMAVEIQEGSVYISIFDSAEGYAAGDPVGQAGKPVAEIVTFTAEGLTPGRYAIRAYHDVNGNGQLDTNVLGIPSEPFAFSNNAAANFGPATFEDAAFEVAAPATIHKMEIK